MAEKSGRWISKWFNQDYLKLYAHRSQEEADQQVAFILKHLELDEKKEILDLGCGQGRHSRAFAREGHNVLGVDQSHDLINLASQSKTTASFTIGDITTFTTSKPYDLVTCLFTSFGYFRTDNENQQVLITAFNVLKPGGFFVLDYLHPHQVLTHLVRYEERNVDGENVVITREIIDRQVVKTIQFPGRQYVEKVTLYTKDEVVKLLEQTGFEVLEVMNDFDGNPWKVDGERQVFIAKREKRKDKREEE